MSHVEPPYVGCYEILCEPCRVTGRDLLVSTFSYPINARERDHWILSQRGARNPMRADRPVSFFVEPERSASGEIVSTLTVLLVNRECPWRCLMCDLWKNTQEETVPIGAIPAQIDAALHELMTNPGQHTGRLSQLKLYNSGSFFDVRAIPPEDYAAIATRAARFDRVIVECHPALVNERVPRFRDLLPSTTQLEIAMGLETAHPETLEKLNKHMTLDQFAGASQRLRQAAIAVRAFVLVQPPFLGAAEAAYWARRSVDFAFDCGASVVSLIPTRFGNGALEHLAEQGLFSPPRLSALEAALDYGVSVRRGRVFADLWDLETFSDCSACFSERRLRIDRINLRQESVAAVACRECGISL